MEKTEDLTERLLVVYWSAKQTLILEFIEHAYELLLYMTSTDDEELIEEMARNLRHTIQRCATQLWVVEKVFGKEATRDLRERFEELLSDVENVNKILAKKFPNRAEKIATNWLRNSIFDYGVGG